MANAPVRITQIHPRHFIAFWKATWCFKLNPGPSNNDDQSAISTPCSRGCCVALSTRSAVLSFAPNVNRLPFHKTSSHGIPVHTTSMRRRDYNRSYMIANLNNIPSLNRVSQVPNSRFCKNFTSCRLNVRSVCNKTLVIKDFVVDHAVDLYHGNMVASEGR